MCFETIYEKVRNIFVVCLYINFDISYIMVISYNKIGMLES